MVVMGIGRVTLQPTLSAGFEPARGDPNGFLVGYDNFYSYKCTLWEWFNLFKCQSKQKARGNATQLRVCATHPVCPACNLGIPLVEGTSRNGSATVLLRAPSSITTPTSDVLSAALPESWSCETEEFPWLLHNCVCYKYRIYTQDGY